MKLTEQQCEDVRLAILESVGQMTNDSLQEFTTVNHLNAVTSINFTLLYNLEDIELKFKLQRIDQELRLEQELKNRLKKMSREDLIEFMK